MALPSRWQSWFQRKSALESAKANQHFIEDGTERKDIGASIDRLASNLFRRHVTDGTQKHSRGSVVGGNQSSVVTSGFLDAGLLRETEVGDVWIVAIEGGWRWRGFGAFGPTTDTYEDRTLSVDLFDTKTKKLLWRGSSTERLSNNSDKNIKNLDKGVEKLFKKFPPSSSRQ
jgi:hypothetical protein